jgi:hypothetical protein
MIDAHNRSAGLPGCETLPLTAGTPEAR